MSHALAEDPAPDRPAPALVSARATIIVALIAMAAHVPGLLAYRPPLLYDDAMFFLRYAEHLAMGEGFRWNLDEPPIWGASAPLWPLLIGALIRAGLTPENSVLAISWSLTLLSAGAAAVAALRVAGISGAAWCILLGSVNWRLCNSGLSGMESPLAMLIVSGGLLTLSGRARWWSVGAIAGLAMAHKVDLAPFGVLLLAAAWLKNGRVPWRAGFVAAAIAGAWYLFAALHFGSVVPNSFITKLNAEYGGMRRDWFLTISLLEGGRPFVTVSALLALPVLWGRKHLLLPAVGLVMMKLAGYTLKPPPEDFGWYQAPLQPALVFLGGVGLGSAVRLVMRSGGFPLMARPLLQGVLMFAVGAITVRQDRPIAHIAHTTVLHTDSDRAGAGRWIAAHTPHDARLLTGFGHIAYHAGRFTYDFTFLNRKGPARPLEDLISEHRPEVLALCIFRTGIPPDRYSGPDGYRVVKIFDSTRKARVSDYYVAVMLRDDVPEVP